MWLSPRPWCCCLGDGPFYLGHGAFCWRCSTERTLSGRFVSPAAVQFLWFHRFVSKRHSPFAITFCMFVPRSYSLLRISSCWPTMSRTRSAMQEKKKHPMPFTTFRVTGTHSRLSLVRLGIHLMGSQLDDLRRDCSSAARASWLIRCSWWAPSPIRSTPALVMCRSGKSSSSFKPNRVRASLRTQLWDVSAKES